MFRKHVQALPGFEPGFREDTDNFKIPSDNHYTIMPADKILAF